MTTDTAIAITDQSQVGQARRAAIGMADQLDLTEHQRGAVGIVATELATNLVRYAQAALLLISSRFGCVDVVAIDRGPGMDVGRCMQDGFSTGGTPGNGLGAVRRMSNEFDVYSPKEGGTIVFARIGQLAVAGPGQHAAFQWGAVAIAAPGETVCGDAWDLSVSETDLRVMVADGLGHGPEASRAAETATQLFQRRESGDPKRFIEQAHTAMTSTRGAALAAGQFSLATGRFLYAGVGNIAGSLVSPEGSRGLVSHNGTVGGHMRSVQQLEYDWSAGSFLVMHSDGIQSRWDLGNYPGLLVRHPAIIAGVLARDFNRGRDDATVVAIRRV